VINREILLVALETAVPLWAAELSRVPLRELLAQGVELAHAVGEVGDVLQCAGTSEGAAAKAFNRLARAIAILSFLDTGLNFCGTRFKQVHPDAVARR
jgi:hypothetical protein